MALQLYSVRFFAVQGLSFAVTYTVPDGMRAVLRDLDVYSDNPGIVVNVFLVGNAGQTIFNHTWSPSDSDSQEWRGRQVLYAGESIECRVDAGSIDATLSGYLLTEP